MKPLTPKSKRLAAKPRRLLLLGVFLFLPVIPLLGVLSMLTLGNELCILRNSLFQSTAANWDKTIEIRAGTLCSALAKVGLNWVDLPEEARAAIRSVRGVEVGVYTRPSASNYAERSLLLTEVDASMTKQGWDRVVGVLNQDALVGIYTPKTTSSSKAVHLCLFVLDKRQLVLVSARGNPQPLVEMALEQIDRNNG
jgi:hypothetical protein